MGLRHVAGSVKIQTGEFGIEDRVSICRQSAHQSGNQVTPAYAEGPHGQRLFKKAMPRGVAAEILFERSSALITELHAKGLQAFNPFRQQDKAHARILVLAHALIDAAVVAS